MHSICVYCGSKVGRHPEYRQAAQRLGELIAARGLRLVYGGGQVGLMGVIADAVLAAGGTVIGVIPDKLATKELLHPGVQEMHVVDTMHARKAKMTQLADAFIAMPGGYGTFDELFEAITWAQLGYHAKPIGLLNTAGYFDPLLQLLHHAVEQDFISSQHAGLIIHNHQPEPLLEQLTAQRTAARP